MAKRITNEQFVEACQKAGYKELTYEKDGVTHVVNIEKGEKWLGSISMTAKRVIGGRKNGEVKWFIRVIMFQISYADVHYIEKKKVKNDLRWERCD